MANTIRRNMGNDRGGGVRTDGKQNRKEMTNEAGKGRASAAADTGATGAADTGAVETRAAASTTAAAISAGAVTAAPSTGTAQGTDVTRTPQNISVVAVKEAGAAAPLWKPAALELSDRDRSRARRISDAGRIRQVDGR